MSYRSGVLALAALAALAALGCSDTDLTGGPGGSTNGPGSGVPDAGIGQPEYECERRVLQADRSSPDILIVLDRSQSMVENDSNTDRWSGSVQAVNTVVAELEDQVRFGLMTFPSGGGGGLFGGGDFCEGGELDVPLRIMNADPIRQSLADGDPAGFTPTAQTLAEARQVLREAATNAMEGEFIVPQYVMLVTDGDPNCFTDGLETGDTAAQQATVQEVQNLANDAVQTYVIGFQTGSTSFAGVLDQMAVAGQTGDTAHRSVNSGDELLAEFRSIAGATATCEFVLNQQVDEQRVNVLVDGQTSEYGEDWDLLDDGRTIRLLGPACDALQQGSEVVADVACENVRLI